jgi:hypothetical protein
MHVPYVLTNLKKFKVLETYTEAYICFLNYTQLVRLHVPLLVYLQKIHCSLTKQDIYKNENLVSWWHNEYTGIYLKAVN